MSAGKCRLSGCKRRERGDGFCCDAHLEEKRGAARARQVVAPRRVYLPVLRVVRDEEVPPAGVVPPPPHEELVAQFEGLFRAELEELATPAAPALSLVPQVVDPPEGGPPPRRWGKTESLKEATASIRKAPTSAEDRLTLLEAEGDRPHNRRECQPEIRTLDRRRILQAAGPKRWYGATCPWVSCRYHLALVYSPESGSYKVLKGWDEDGRPTCALDVADEGGMTLEGIGQLLGVTRERVRQILIRSLIRWGSEALELDADELAARLLTNSY